MNGKEKRSSASVHIQQDFTSIITCSRLIWHPRPDQVKQQHHYSRTVPEEDPSASTKKKLCEVRADQGQPKDTCWPHITWKKNERTGHALCKWDCQAQLWPAADPFGAGWNQPLSNLGQLLDSSHWGHYYGPLLQKPCDVNPQQSMKNIYCKLIYLIL